MTTTMMMTPTLVVANRSTEAVAVATAAVATAAVAVVLVAVTRVRLIPYHFTYALICAKSAKERSDTSDQAMTVSY
jgi:hypothetical protein